MSHAPEVSSGGGREYRLTELDCTATPESVEDNRREINRLVGIDGDQLRFLQVESHAVSKRAVLKGVKVSVKSWGGILEPARSAASSLPDPSAFFIWS